MGMAASQARFLSLTAKKTNTEYEGQQINQQRTSLSNESSAQYSRLAGLTVPTPPSATDYTKIVYTFENGGEQNTITNLIAQKDGYYLLNYTREMQVDSMVSNGTVFVTRLGTQIEGKDNYSYYIGASKLRPLGVNDPDDKYLASLSADELQETLAVEKQYAQMLTDKYSDKDWCVRYQKTAEGIYSPSFYSLNQIKNASFNESGVSYSGIKSYILGQATETKEIKNSKARVEQDSSGRYISMVVYEKDSEGNEFETSYALNSATITNDRAYDDAMNKYNYDKEQYAQKVQQINSKLAQIQNQDRSLELKLKQLDTEHNAIATEMDAVKKVVSKNVENTFKTFEA